MEKCTVKGCDRPLYVKSRGWCSVHYNRWITLGSPEPDGIRIVGDDVARFWSKVEKSDGCWQWQGTTSGRGRYGVFSVSRKPVYAHRWVYEQEVGQIPEAFQIDHTCGNHLCMRPDHLEAVTQAENLRRQLVANGSLGRTCDEPGCDRKHRAFGLCNMHFQRWNKAGRPAR